MWLYALILSDEVSMKMIKYNITVRKSLSSGEEHFEARVLELPDVVEYADSYEEAYALAVDTIETTAEIYKEKGKALPAALGSANDLNG